MATYNSQVIYNWSGDAAPVKIGEGENEKKLVAHSDFMDAICSSEETMAQKITQDNAETKRLQDLVDDQGLTTLDTTLGTLPEAIAEINKIYTILTGLVSKVKDRG